MDWGKGPRSWSEERRRHGFENEPKMRVACWGKAASEQAQKIAHPCRARHKGQNGLHEFPPHLWTSTNPDPIHDHIGRPRPHARLDGRGEVLCTPTIQSTRTPRISGFTSR